MRVPRYEQQAPVPQIPTVRMRDPVMPEAYGVGIGRVLQDAGNKLASVAAKQQEEADRMSLALLSAKADAYAEEVYVREQNDPDYEGTINRFNGDWEKYYGSTMESVPERLRDKAAQILEVKGMSYKPKFQGLFLTKQNDAIKAGYMATVDTLIQNKDLAGLTAHVPLMEKYSEQERQRILQAGTKQIEGAIKEDQFDGIMGVLMKTPYAKVDWSDKEKYPYFDNGDILRLERFQKGLINEIKAEQERRAAQARRWRGDQMENLLYSAKSTAEFMAGAVKLDLSPAEMSKLVAAFTKKQTVYDDIQSGLKNQLTFTRTWTEVKNGKYTGADGVKDLLMAIGERGGLPEKQIKMLTGAVKENFDPNSNPLMSDLNSHITKVANKIDDPITKGQFIQTAEEIKNTLPSDFKLGDAMDLISGLRVKKVTGGSTWWGLGSEKAPVAGILSKVRDLNAGLPPGQRWFYDSSRGKVVFDTGVVENGQRIIWDEDYSSISDLDQYIGSPPRYTK